LSIAAYSQGRFKISGSSFHIKQDVYALIIPRVCFRKKAYPTISAYLWINNSSIWIYFDSY
jgi:hypothetical protein